MKENLMIKKNLKSFFKSIQKKPFNYIVAILSLAIGLTLFIHSFSYFLYYYSYDKNLKDYKHWFRVNLITQFNNNTTYNQSLFYQNMIKPLMEENPQIKDCFFIENRIIPINLWCDEKSLPYWDRLAISPDYLKKLNVKIIKGDPDSVFSEPRSMIFSRSTAMKYFGTTNIIGKKVYLSNKRLVYFTIKGVFEDLPANMHYRHDVYDNWIDDYRKLEVDSENIYDNNLLYTFIKLDHPKSADLIEKNINRYLKQFKNPEYSFSATLTPYHEMHFTRGFTTDFETADSRFGILLLIISSLVLLAAIFNFINLLVLSWKSRFHEFVFRKTFGASGRDLFKLLLTEYNIMVISSLIISLILYLLTESFFKQFTNLQLDIFQLTNNKISFQMLILIILITEMFGLGVIQRYSRLKGQQGELVHRRSYIGWILAFQIGMSVFFICLSASMSLQMRKVLQHDPGINLNGLYQYSYITAEGLEQYNYTSPTEVLRRLKEINNVRKVSAGNFGLSFTRFDNMYRFPMDFYSQTGNKKTLAKINLHACRKDLLSVLESRVIEGDLDSIQYYQVIISESAAKIFFPGQKAIGKKLRLMGNENGIISSGNTNFVPEVKAVIKDITEKSLHEKIIPTMYIIDERHNEKFFVYVSQENSAKAIKEVDAVFEDLSKDKVLYYSRSNVKENYLKLYQQDRQFVVLSMVFSFFSFMMALVGIYSLSSLHLQQEMKNISIRKINGAEVRDLYRVYLPYYLKYIIPAGFMGAILAWYIGDLFNTRFAISSGFNPLISIVGILLVSISSLVPLFIKIRTAYQSKPVTYLNEE